MACRQTALSRARWLLGGEIIANDGLADSHDDTATWRSNRQRHFSHGCEIGVD